VGGAPSDPHIVPLPKIRFDDSMGAGGGGGGGTIHLFPSPGFLKTIKVLAY
jgi:hypothetical protein